MQIELINTGSELMLGRVLNTHQQWICRQLADLGYTVTRQAAIADTCHDIEQAVRDALTRADLVITTGGLGPTSDDLTRDLIAQLLGRSLREDLEAVRNIENFFQKRNRPMPERVKTQALVPEGALVLQNGFGLAPGVAIELRPNPYRNDRAATLLVMLPGPPRELQPMFRDSVVPLLRQKLPPERAFFARTLRTIGLGESMIQEKIAPGLAALVARGLEIGYCARVGQVDVRLAASGPDGSQVVAEAEELVRHEIAVQIFGVEHDELEAVVVRELTASGKTLALAESCTGGLIANKITNVPGASAVLVAGVVAYSNEAKQKFLGVRPETLAAHGAVSEPTAIQMADGVRRETGADYAISVTGIVGPSGGTPEKPAGTVFICLATPAKTFPMKFYNPYDRETFKQVTACQALDLLRRKLPG